MAEDNPERRLLGDDRLTRMHESSRSVGWPASSEAPQNHVTDIGDGSTQREPLFYFRLSTTRRRSPSKSGPVLRSVFSASFEYCCAKLSYWRRVATLDSIRAR